MKRTVWLLLVIAFFTLKIQAEDNWLNPSTDYEVQPLEGELMFGFSCPAESYHGSDADISLNMGIALRYNIPYTKFDIGVLLDLTGVGHKWPHYDDHNRQQRNRILSFALTGAYNFRQGRKINPFAGIGLGIGRMDVVDDRALYDINKSYNVVFIPRIGCEFFNILRIYASSHVIRRGFNSFEIGLGLTIGGWKKKD